MNPTAPEAVPESVPDKPVCPAHPDEPVVATCSRCGRFVCKACRGEDADPLCPECWGREGTRKPQGIGGWLVLPLINLFVQPVAFLTVLGTFVAAVRRYGVDAVLGDPRWLGLNALNLVIVGGVAAFALYILPKYFAKLRGVPRLMKAFYLLTVGGNFVQGIATALFASTEGKDPSDTATMVRSVVLGIVWVMYFARSERVKRTFVK